MLTVSEEADDLMAALRGGAQGYLLKNIDSDFLVDSVRRAAAGESVMSPEMTAKLLRELRGGGAAAQPALSPREREILAFIARGASNKEIARDARGRREHRQDPRPAHPAEARALEPRAGGGVGDRARDRRQDLTGSPSPRAQAIGCRWA